jgi:hypothetical protein
MAQAEAKIGTVESLKKAVEHFENAISMTEKQSI